MTLTALAPYAPVLTLSLGSLGYLLSGPFLERARLTSIYALILIAAAGYLVVGLAPVPFSPTFGFVVDNFTQFFALLACLGAFVSIIGTSSSLDAERVGMVSEYYFLMLTSLCGALVMIFASDFLTLFIGVEVASLGLYCLCGARVTEGSSSESALKYFLLGCVSSAFMLFGIALWYGNTGALLIVKPESVTVLTTLSFILMMVGFAFKIGLAPFHFWVPDVYQGAPTSVTTFMSCVVKVAAFGALFKVALQAFSLPSEWSTGILWFLAVVAMTVGNFAALQQRSVKRMLAYSSVAQAGYIMIGLVALDDATNVLASSIFYLTSYCAMTIGAFTVLSVLGPDADDLDDLKGLGKRSPFLAICMTLFFLALAGLPPSMAGLMGKVFLFTGALSAGFYGLAIIAVLNSALACAYYFRVPAAMLFQPATSSEGVKVSAFSTFALTFCVAAVIGIGLFPEPLVAMCESVAGIARQYS